MQKWLSKIKVDWWSVSLIIISVLSSLIWLNWNIKPLTQIDSDLFLRLADQVNKFQLPDLAHRTPLLPLFLAILKELGGLKGVVATQILLGAITIYLIYKIIKSVSKNQTLAGLSALMMVLDPLIISHQSAIMSETLGLFFLMLFFWLHLQLLNKLTKKRLILMVVTDILLIMSRPVYIILPIGVYLYHLISGWWFNLGKARFRRKLILTAITINCLFLISYQSINYFKHGFFGMTVVSQFNLLGKTLQYGYLNKVQINQSTPEDVKQVVLAYLENPDEKSPYSLINKSHPEIHSTKTLLTILKPVNKYFIRTNWIDFVKKTINLIPQTFTTDRYYYDSVNFDNFTSIKTKIDQIYNQINRMKLIGLIIWLVTWFKWYLIEKNKTGYHVGILLMGVIYTMVIISIFSHNDYVRLRVPAEPLLSSMIIIPVVYWSLKILDYAKSE